MNWTDLAPTIAPFAPTLGRLLGGALPIPFGSAIGEVAGKAIAAAMGVEPRPEAVQQAATSTHVDVVRAQLQEAEAEAAAKWQSLAQAAAAEATVGVAQVSATAQTTQAELINGTWYQRWWRPLAMYVWIASWPIQLGEILWHINSRDPIAIANLATVINSLALWNAGPAALAGVYSWNRTQEKVANGHE